MKKPNENLENLLTVSESKSKLSVDQLIFRGILAGFYIGLGALFFLTVTAHGASNLVGGLCFCLGLILVVVAGAELFTGNNLMSVGLFAKKICPTKVLRNWFYVYFANLLGSLLLVLLFYFSGLAEGVLAEKVVAVASRKMELPLSEAFFRAILCNILVCLAVWMASAAQDVSGKILAIVFPITAFVAMGHEHSVANMFFLPAGLALSELSVSAAMTNILFVSLGNIVGGALFLGILLYGSFKSE